MWRWENTFPEKFGSCRYEVREESKYSIRMNVIIGTPSPGVIRVNELRSMKRTEQVACMSKMETFLNIYLEY
jgi:hypothetical protein